MHVDAITSIGEAASLAAAWDALSEAGGDDALFRSWAWAEAWWNAYAATLGAALHVVVCRDRDEIVGLAPLYVAPANGVDVLRLLGSGGDTAPDYLNVLARRGREREVAEAVVAHLAGSRGPRWDAIDLTDLPADEPMTTALEAALRERFGLRAARTAHAVCPFVELSPTVEAHLAAMPGKLRYNIRSRRKKLERDHAARFFVWDDRARVTEAIDRLAELHRLRFTARGERHGFASPAYVGFHRDVAARFFKKERLRLYCLEVEGRVVAMLYAFRAGSSIYHYQSGFDPEWAKAGVGQVLVASALEHAIGEGARRFDFLKGEYAYKDEWATGRRTTSRLVSGRLSPGGLVHLYRHVLRPALGRRLRAA